MNKANHGPCALVLAWAGWSGASLVHAADFSYTLDQPALVTIPGTPSIEMGPHPRGGVDRPHLRAFGVAGDFVASVMAPTADADMDASRCAASLTARIPGSIVKPAMESLQQFRLDDTNFLVYYIGMADLRIHAHLYSWAPGHCVDVHISRGRAPRHELMDWLLALSAARVRVPAPAPDPKPSL
jgi:hypothetical protein